MRRGALVAVGALALLSIALGGCKRSKPPLAKKAWLGPSGGCVETLPHPKVGTFACWGNVGGQVTDGADLFATKKHFAEGVPSSLSIGAHHACAVFDHRKAYCWGEGGKGQLGGSTSKVSLVPTPTEDEGDDLAVAVSGAHTCVRSGMRDKLRCFGDDAEGQLGPREWGTGGQEIRAFALGDAHTCVAYARSKAQATGSAWVQCKGRAVAAPTEKLLAGVNVTALAAGLQHTCAVTDQRTVLCWGKNDSGQLGDGTTNDARAPIQVLDLQGVDAIAAGDRHTCARLTNGTVSCWGANDHHQLANGGTDRSARAAVVLGALGVQEITAAGDGTCARLGDGYVRCWGANDRGQLGDGSTVEHTVPMTPKYR